MSMYMGSWQSLLFGLWSEFPRSLQSRSISYYILRRMLGETISFLLGLRPTDQIYYYDYLVLQHLGRALNLVWQQICIQTQK